MARRRRSQGELEGQRDDLLHIANALPDPLKEALLTASDVPFRSPLRDLEDRREFYPVDVDQVRPAAGTTKKSSSLVNRARPSGPLATRPPDMRLQFWTPKRVAICIRRHARREIMHALKKVGRGSGKSRRRRNHYSDVRC